MRDRTGPNNPNWKGGRIVEPRGYVLVRVGVGHHLADCRGYAYEHRIIAERNLGRRLRSGEEAHHDDNNPGNNEPGNIKPCRNHAEHALFHRKTGKRHRVPGERNPTVMCACGCRGTFRRFDWQGRRRYFISGHNTAVSKKRADGTPMPILEK